MSIANEEKPTEARRLRRTLGVLGVAAITLAEITPATSVFVIAPVAVTAVGTGALWSFVIAAAIGLCMAFCYAELAATFPFAGGDYVLTGRPLGPAIGFGMFALFMVNVVVAAIFAKGAVGYLGSVVHGADNRYTAVAFLVVTCLIAMCTIRINAIVAGIFLSLELALLAALVILGFFHSHRSLPTVLAHPQALSSDGTLQAVAVSAIVSFTGAALFSYSGYGSAAYLGEEAMGAGRSVARAIQLAFGVTVITEIVPIAAVLIGAPSLKELSLASAPMSYFVSSLGGSWFGDVVSIGIFLAIFNAQIAGFVIFGRVLYSTGRDRAWPSPINAALSWLHPVLGTPPWATATAGAIAIGCVFAPEKDLVLIVGAGVVFNYILIALAALVARRRHQTDRSPYRMPLWPLPPILALIGLGYIAQKQTAVDLAWPGAIFGGAVLYYVLSLRPRRATRWLMINPDAAAPEGSKEEGTAE